jgi:hypothetical protein
MLIKEFKFFKKRETPPIPEIKEPEFEEISFIIAVDDDIPYIKEKVRKILNKRVTITDRHDREIDISVAHTEIILRDENQYAVNFYDKFGHKHAIDTNVDVKVHLGKRIITPEDPYGEEEWVSEE